MAIKKPIPITFNLDSRQSVQSVCAVIHIDDKNTETLDLSLMQGGEHIAVFSNSTVTARFVRVKDKILISDNVPCTVQENGNILIPIDNAAAHMLVGEIKIEVNIVDENDVLTMQFPLVIRVNNTILADAEISPESEGTIPELLEEAREAAEDAAQAAKAATEAISTKQDKLTANDYTDLINKPSINNVTLSGNKSSDDLNLQGKLTAGQNITIEGNVISAEGGVTSYNDLTDKPKVWGATGHYDLDKILYFPDFDLSLNGWVRQLSLKPLNYGKLENGESYYMHEEFKNSVNLNVLTLDLYGKWFCFDANNAVGLPSGIDVVTSRYENQNKKVVWGSYRSCQINAGFADIELPLIEEIYWTDSNLKNHHAVRTYFKDTTNVKKFTDWTELTGGGAQIVSGVVNVNGTITFTDSEGNSFTTSGESVIGADGFSPVATVTQTASGATVSITDSTGTTTANISNGQDGTDYVLTNADKQEIAQMAVNLLPNADMVSY